MDAMKLEQLVVRVQAIMADTEEPEEIAAAQPAHMQTGTQRHEIICYTQSHVKELLAGTLRSGY